MIYPLNNPVITQEYGHTWFALNYGQGIYPNVDGKPFHNGIDFGAYDGQPCYAISEGKVIESGFSNGWGNYVRIKHSDNYISHYAHFRERLVSVGQEVKEGDKIGLCDSTGWSTGHHLHFGIYNDQNNFVDPIEYLDRKEYMNKDQILDLLDLISQHKWRLLNDMKTPDMTSIRKENAECLEKYEKGEKYAFASIDNMWFENFLKEHMKKSDCNAEQEREKFLRKEEELGKLLKKYDDLKNQSTKEISSLKSQIKANQIAIQSANDDTFEKNAEIDKLKEQLKKCEIEYTWQEHMSMAIKKLLNPTKRK